MPIFRGIATSSIRDGSMTLFWKDNWLGTVNSESFLRAFSYAIEEDILVQKFSSSTRLSDTFLLPLSPEAMDEVRTMQHAASDIQLCNDHDVWSYPWGKNYTPNNFYNFCFSEFNPHVSFLCL
jgi:hypothetical protein